MYIYRGFLIILLLAGFGPFLASAQSLSSTQVYQDKLQVDYDQAQKELETLTAQSNEIKSQKASLQRDIALIDAQIKEAQAKINLKTIAISKLTKDIGIKQNTISDLEAKLDRSFESMANLLRHTQESDAISLPIIMFGNRNFSQFFREVDSIQTVKEALNTSIDDVKNFKQETETEKIDLEDRKNQETNAREEILTAQRIIQRKKTEKNNILKVTKGAETAYAKLIEEKERRIAQISTALFALRDTDGIQFGKALEYANIASEKTGVRPAFILAILTQETSLGKNLGSCYLRDYTSGAGVSVKTGDAKPRTMNPTRDVQLFLDITRNLGLNPQATRVSCWIAMYSRGKASGWGGAMGPAQFIPSTWNIFDQRIEKVLGISLANPWDPEHAILASALYLSDLGAGLQTFSAEKNAACRYYSGKSCSAGTGATYGSQVMTKTANIQECMIDPILGKSSGC
ncbi:MAG: lytic murein transglycosylase [Patescibacteria group bacterium]